MTLGEQTESEKVNGSTDYYAGPGLPPAIVFSVTDGVYQYTVNPSADEFQPSSGTVTVDGGDVLVVVGGPVTSCTMVVTTSS